MYKEKFISLLQQARPDDADKIINNLEKLGFFEAPASTMFHLNVAGGLVQHCVSVCETALKLRTVILFDKPELEARLPENSIVTAALLHDVCKAEIYKPSTKNVKNPNTGVWEQVPYYDVDYSHFPAGHGEKSVIRLLQWGVNLTMDEILAIRWHMGPWDVDFNSREAMGNLNAAKTKCPLLALLQCADGLSSAIME